MSLMDKLRQLFNRRKSDESKDVVMQKEAAQDRRLDALMQSFRKEAEFYELQQSARKPK